jgi:hypothetical protein
MTGADFAVPTELRPELRQLHEYWESLKRGYGVMPYWDDVQTSQLADLEDRLILLDRIEQKDRFRFRISGSAIEKTYGGELVGHFLDEVPLSNPFDRLAEQVETTVIGRLPTYYHHGASEQGNVPYARLLLPLWGAGRIDMILGAVVEDD